MTRLRTSLLLALGALGVMGCAADGNNAMIILNVAVPSGEECEVTPSAETFSDQGTLDLEGNGFHVTARIKGTLDEDPNAATRHHVVINSANVELLAAPTQRSEQLVAGLGDLARRTVLTSGTLEPGDESLVTVGITLIDSEQNAAIMASGAYEDGVQLIASFKINGSVDGNSVESYAFNYPITLCTDCVLDLEDCLPDPASPEEPITSIDDCKFPDRPGRAVGSLCYGDQIP